MARILLCLLLMASFGRAADTASLEIRVVEGDGAVYAAGSRATHGVTVQVSDANGRPVDGATVSFSLPGSGAGGVFASGSRTELVTTHADGRAAVWGMLWNRTPGSFQIRIAAVKGQARGTIVSAQSLVPADKAAAGARINTGRGNHKLLWISLAAAGAAVAGVAGASLGKSGASGPSTASPTAGTTIGAPTISLGHP